MTTLTQAQEAQFRELVIAQHGEVFTTSRQVAELFGKDHRNVLRAIRLLDCDEEFTALNFELTDFIDKNGDPRPEYLISKDGMVFLVMGFTGKKAAQFKLLYIRAFNWMMEQLHENRDLQHHLHDFARREALSVSKGSFHGQGLAQRRIEKRALGIEQAQLKARAHLSLVLTGTDAA